MENRKIKIEKKNKMNVKPKNLNVMKRNLFKLMMLFSLVVIANSAFAQPQTAPVVGASYLYTVSPLNNGDHFDFSVNTSTTTVGGSASATIGTASGTVASNTASTTITWSGTSPLNLWISLTGTATGSCSNQRYITVTPTENVFDAEIIALGTSVGDFYTGWGTATTTTANDCFVYSTGFDFEDNSATTSDGSSYVFFKIIATSNGSSTWDISSVSTFGGVSPEYSTSASGPWSALGSLSGIAANQDVLVRYLVPNNPSGTSGTVTVAATENTGLTPLADSNSGNDAVTFAVNPFPSMGTGTSTIFN